MAMSHFRQTSGPDWAMLVAVIEDFERCYVAVQSRDPRFDGWFFTAVTSTRIYCRPSCPAKTPMRKNVRFYPSAAAAQLAGFRACKRCRPDATPGSPEWNIRADVRRRAMRLIADGLVDREGVSGARPRNWVTASVNSSAPARAKSARDPSPSPGPSAPRPHGSSSRPPHFP